MSTMNISLPDVLKAFVDDQDRQRLRGLLHAGALRGDPRRVSPAYFLP